VLAGEAEESGEKREVRRRPWTHICSMQTRRRRTMYVGRQTAGLAGAGNPWLYTMM
jgi:hypothetical protein